MFPWYLSAYQRVKSQNLSLPGFSDIEIIPSSPYRLASSFENTTFA